MRDAVMDSCVSARYSCRNFCPTSLMKRVQVILFFQTLLILHAACFAGGVIGFGEKFALAANREKVLDELVPGTEDYYYYHALHYQNTRQSEKLSAILEEWKKRFPHSQRCEVIENREALLDYDSDPQRTLKYLKKKLSLQFNDARQTPDRQPDLPSTLDETKITREAFLQLVLNRGSDLGSQVSQSALEEMVRNKTALNAGNATNC